MGFLLKDQLHLMTNLDWCRFTSSKNGPILVQLAGQHWWMLHMNSSLGSKKPAGQSNKTGSKLRGKLQNLNDEACHRL
jgi:hypothetical protein